MRIGILGGTFNPIHMGHLILAQEAMCRLKLDRVVFIPTYIPPHKKEKIIDAKDRYHMVFLAIRGNPKFEVSRIEIDSRQRSYSVDTLRKFRQIYKPGTKLFFIAGSDLIGELSTWKHIEEIFKLAKFVVAKRPGFAFKKAPRRIKILRISGIDISSTNIRRRIKKGEPIAYLVPEDVECYIKAKRLYR